MKAGNTQNSMEPALEGQERPQGGQGRRKEEGGRMARSRRQESPLVSRFAERVSTGDDVLMI